MKFIFLLLILSALGGAITPVVSSAALCTIGTCTAGACPPNSPAGSTCNQTGNCVHENKLNLCYPQFPGAPLLEFGIKLDSLVAWLYVFIVGISGLAAFVMIVWGGVQWMSSQGDPTATKDAKDKIQKALLGLLLVLASFLILQIINPELTLLKNPEP